MPAPQSFKNHTRWDPMFHFVLGPIFLLNIIFSAIWYWHHRYAHVHSGPWLVIMSVALFMLAGLVRGYSLKVQDRVIRLEERTRLASLCSPTEMAELNNLTIPQFVGLRFASDAEVASLARRAVTENLTQKQIKESIVSWRPDNDRI